MRLFDYSWFDNYDEKIEFLSNLAMSEKWDYTNSENFKPHPILRNYIDHTFKKVYTDNTSLKTSSRNLSKIKE